MAGKSGRSWDSELGGPDPAGREDVLEEHDAAASGILKPDPASTASPLPADPPAREDVLSEDDQGSEDELAPEARADAGATSGGPDAGDSASAADVTAEPADVAIDAGTITVPDPTPTTSASSGPDPRAGSTSTSSYPYDLSRGKAGSQVADMPPSRWRSFWANIFKGTPAQ